MPDVQDRLIAIIRKLCGRRPTITLDPRVNFDLTIEGDDASDLLDEIHREFGTSFQGMDERKFFKDEGFEIQLRFWRMGKLPLTVRHLLQVVEKGVWFEPVE